MNSTELVDYSTWLGWFRRAVRQVPQKPGVYIFRLIRGATLARLKGNSDIIYIGSTKKGKRTLRDRLKDHLSPRGDRRDLGYRLKRVIKEVGSVEVACKVFDSHEGARACERQLLKRFEQDHIELPPLNRQETGKTQLQMEDTLRAATPQKLLEACRKCLQPEAQRVIPSDLTPQDHEYLVTALASLAMRKRRPSTGPGKAKGPCAGRSPSDGPTDPSGELAFPGARPRSCKSDTSCLATGTTPGHRHQRAG